MPFIKLLYLIYVSLSNDRPRDSNALYPFYVFCRLRMSSSAWSVLVGMKIYETNRVKWTKSTSMAIGVTKMLLKTSQNEKTYAKRTKTNRTAHIRCRVPCVYLVFNSNHSTGCNIQLTNKNAENPKSTLLLHKCIKLSPQTKRSARKTTKPL